MVEEETPKVSRKSPEQLVQAIYDALPVESLKNKSLIAKEIHAKESTVEDYLRLIMWIQDQPKVVEVRIGTRRYAWHKERSKKEVKSK